MNQIEEFKSLMNGFRNLNTKVQDNNKTLKEKIKDMIIKACQKEYQKIYFQYEVVQEKLKVAEQKINELEQKNKKRRQLIEFHILL